MICYFFKKGAVYIVTSHTILTDISRKQCAPESRDMPKDNQHNFLLHFPLNLPCLEVTNCVHFPMEI